MSARIMHPGGGGYHDPHSYGTLNHLHHHPGSSMDMNRPITPHTPGFDPRAMPIPMNRSSQDANPANPTQVLVKVIDPTNNKVTLVISTNISYQSLIDRIDAKLTRTINFSLIASGYILKYKDDADFVTIQSDDDVQTAFETWKEQPPHQPGRFELHCKR